MALGIQAYNVVYYQTLVSAYLGGGVALLVIGAMATLHEIDDRRTELCSRNCVFPDSQAADDTLQAPPRTAADPSPDEYDQRFRDL